LYSYLADGAFLSTTPTSALNSQVIQFADFVRKVEQANPGAEITLTGYSLGEEIAQIAGYYAHVQTVTFLAPGGANLVPAFASSIGYLGTLGMLSPSQGIWDYRQEGDLISLAGKQVGQSITAVNPNIPTGESGNTLEADIYANFLTNKNYHAISTLSQTLASQPTTPGFIGSLEQLGDPDGFVSQTVHYAVITGALSTFVVPQLQQAAIQGFDPPPGYSYSLVDAPGSPEFASIDLPVGDVFGWDLTYFLDTGGSGTEFSSTGQFTFGPGVDRLDFYAVDANGNPIFNPDPFILGLTVDSTGDFEATITTDTNPPGTTSVPEPGTLALLTVGLAILPFAQRRRVRSCADKQWRDVTSISLPSAGS